MIPIRFDGIEQPNERVSVSGILEGSTEPTVLAILHVAPDPQARLESFLLRDRTFDSIQGFIRAQSSSHWSQDRIAALRVEDRHGNPVTFLESRIPSGSEK